MRTSEAKNEGGRLVWVLFLAGVLLAGCGGVGSRADIVICNGAEPESLDPALVTSQPDFRLVGSMFEGLTRLNERTGSAEPGLAERWEILNGGRTYLFHLRTNLTWSTGEPIRAEDVVYSWRRVADPATAAPYAGHLFYVVNAARISRGEPGGPWGLGVEAVDDWTVRVELDSPTAFFIEICAFPALAVVPRRVIEAHGPGWTRVRPLPVSGPYTLEFWRIHDRIRLGANGRYWDAGRMRNRTVDFLPINSAAAALNLYETGQADIIWDKSLIPAELVDLLLEGDRTDCHTFDYLATYFLRFNTTRPPFDDVRVRKALALAVDKERVVTRITRAGEVVASNLIPAGVAHYEPPEGLGYDVGEARALLAAAGYPGGVGFPRVTYLFNSGRLHQRIAVELQQMWQENLGVRVELRQTETQVFLGAQRSLDYDLCRSSWVGDYNDPNTFLELFTRGARNNRTGWGDDRYDRLIREGNEELDGGRRARLLREAETLLVREGLPILPLYFYKGMMLYDPGLLGGIHENVLDQHPVRAIERLD